MEFSTMSAVLTTRLFIRLVKTELKLDIIHIADIIIED